MHIKRSLFTSVFLIGTCVCSSAGFTKCRYVPLSTITTALSPTSSRTVFCVPRLTAHFPLERLRSGEAEGISTEAASMLCEAAARVTDALHAPFNSIGLNFYRDGNDSVAPHNDRLQDLVEDEPIALLSFGGTRRMLIRSKRPGEPAVPIDLEAGSLLVMSHASQLHYTHGVAKTKAKVDPRISVALRVRPRD